MSGKSLTSSVEKNDYIKPILNKWIKILISLFLLALKNTVRYTIYFSQGSDWEKIDLCIGVY